MGLQRSTVGLMIYAALAGVSAVALSAFAAHGLEKVAPTGAQGVAWFVQATDFQMNHTLAIMLLALLTDRFVEGLSRKLLLASAVLMAIGIILFAGSLYSLSFNGPGALAPLGGFSSMTGWIIMGVGGIVGLKRGEIGTGYRTQPQAAE
ncbi:MAG: DUF423 domain-containing protein [Rhodospirillaceae bacterium]|nr:DUF423 domain-containing protein [Rhodospirillaceae bacterium]